MLNRVILIGRLTRDPELRYTPAGVPVAHFSLAVSRPFSNQQGEQETDFIDIVVWRKQAETCANYLGKGRLAAIEGRLQSRSYETPDGQRRRVWEVVADRVTFLDSKGKVGSTASEDEFVPEESVPAGAADDVPF
ncbi:MAG TPA: single-stranded DNA-binding protein [Clostridia bacterium]|nr:single-stranded DNA-binding protein [Clostridia bacterium]